MFNLRGRQLISNEISKYIKDSTNKSLEKYKKNHGLYNKNIPLHFFGLLPFVSLISFLVGYNLDKVIKH